MGGSHPVFVDISGPGFSWTTTYSWISGVAAGRLGRPGTRLLSCLRRGSVTRSAPVRGPGCGGAGCCTEPAIRVRAGPRERLSPQWGTTHGRTLSSGGATAFRCTSSDRLLRERGGIPRERRLDPSGPGSILGGGERGWRGDSHEVAFPDPLLEEVGRHNPRVGSS